MERDEALRRLESVSVATLATISPDGRAHLVPMVYALEGSDLVTAIDDKPKSSSVLRRVENIRRDPRVTVLAHHYQEDWNALWWVRIDGLAGIEEQSESFERAVNALRIRYRQYQTVLIRGPVIRIAIGAVSGWSADVD